MITSSCSQKDSSQGGSGIKRLQLRSSFRRTINFKPTITQLPSNISIYSKWKLRWNENPEIAPKPSLTGKKARGLHDEAPRIVNKKGN
jgi:hypothetical protein